MKMQLKISGMHCQHCQAACENALNGIEGVKAKVDLKKGTAEVQMPDSVDLSTLEAAVSDAGYKVENAKEKKGLFGI